MKLGNIRNFIARLKCHAIKVTTDCNRNKRMQVATAFDDHLGGVNRARFRIEGRRFDAHHGPPKNFIISKLSQVWSGGRLRSRLVLTILAQTHR